MYAVDINPVFEKVSTCGQGSATGSGYLSVLLISDVLRLSTTEQLFSLVIIWNLKPIKSEEASCDESIARTLATIEFPSERLYMQRAGILMPLAVSMPAWQNRNTHTQTHTNVRSNILPFALLVQLTRIRHLFNDTRKICQNQVQFLFLKESCTDSEDVNSIRWSTDGTRFACGSDDKQVLRWLVLCLLIIFTLKVTVWEFGGEVRSAGTIGKRGTGNREIYRCIYTLASHTMEVTTLKPIIIGSYV